MASKRGTLLLLPNLLGDCRHHEPFLPASVDKAVQNIDGLIAESESGGRRYLSRFDLNGRDPREIPIALFKGRDQDVDFFLEPLLLGESWGLVSDAGLPCIADPGAKLVARARQLGIAIKAFVGPSALLHALMLSGLPAQRFCFHGYPPKRIEECRDKLLEWQRAARDNGSTQVFIEAPHRNAATLESCLATLEDKFQFCVAWELTLPTQGLVVAPIRQWKKIELPQINKKPAIFLFSPE